MTGKCINELHVIHFTFKNALSKENGQIAISYSASKKQLWHERFRSYK